MYRRLCVVGRWMWVEMKEDTKTPCTFNDKGQEIYDKFGGSYGDLIEEHLRVLNELKKCRQLLDEQASKKIKEIK